MTSASRIASALTPTRSRPPPAKRSSNCQASRASPRWVRRRTTIWTCSTATSATTCLRTAGRDRLPTGRYEMAVDDDRLEEELARSRSLRTRSVDLRRRLAGVAGAVARTEDEVADV